jgi:hypothetical protein
MAGLAAATALVLATVSATFAQTQPAPGAGGMMGGNGQGNVPGMMGGTSQQGFPQATPLTSLSDAKVAFQTYVERTANPDLALDEVMQFELNFYAIVKQQSTGQGAFELLADPLTGVVFPEFGPNMMWNTTYGHMGAMGGMANMMGSAPGMMGGSPTGMTGGTSGMMSGAWGPTVPTVAPSVSADQAQQIARQWLDTTQPGSTTETPDVFPGYYTLHITRDGQITGMLSVNAYTGQVWFHAWHGSFRASTEA